MSAKPESESNKDDETPPVRIWKILVLSQSQPIVLIDL
jgi:hypothetical protein